jgi:2-polyprenyl-3-methyl-5-hydroxy-6-metoxy-1,4-benzoquinol methylase
MKRDLLGFLVDAKTGKFLTLHGEREEGGEVVGGILSSPGGQEFPILGGIPRFVPPSNYASSFGYQWNKYAELQLDSRNGTTFSRDRFFSITEWKREDLRGARVLDVGCGAGRFAEIALAAGANVVAVDLSQAVEACRKNLGPGGSLEVVQASIYELPFPAGSFDFVYCIGVVQHTPDPKKSVLEIARMVRPGGRLGFWIYERDWKSYLGTVGFKYLLRPWTKSMTRERVEKFCNLLESLCWPVNRVARKCGLPGKVVMRLLPVSSAHLQEVPLSDEDFREWVRLDTFDMYSPAHDHPQKFETVERWLTEAGFEVDSRHPHGGISITARRPL